MARYTYETTISFGSEDRADFAEMDVTVSFSVSWGCPSSYRGPAEDDEVSDITLIKVGDRFAPWNLHHHSDRHLAALVVEALEDSERDLERMLEIANEEEAGAADVRAERRWEEMRGVA